MKRITTLVVAMMAMALLPSASFCQEKANARTDFKDYIYISGDAGLMFLNGQIDNIKPAFDCRLGLGYQMTNVLGFKLNVGAGLMKGEFENDWKSNGDFYSADVNLTLNMMDIILGYKPGRRFNITPHIGIGTLHFRSALKDENDEFVVSYGEKGNNKPYNESGNGIIGRKTATTVPMGASVSYQLSTHWGIYADWTYYFVDTDKLDAVVMGDHQDRMNNVHIGATYRIKNNYNPFIRYEEYCNNWFIMFEAGAVNTQGDISSTFDYLKSNFGIGAGYRFHNIFSVYAKLNRGGIDGRMKSGSNIHAIINYGEYYNATMNFSFDLVGAILGYREDRPMSVSPHIGIGLINYKNDLIYSNGEHAYVGYNETGRKGGNGIGGMEMAMSIPAGLEVAYDMTPRWGIYLDGTVTYVNKDNLDGLNIGPHADYLASLNAGLRYKFKNSCERAQNDFEEEKPLPQMSCCDSIPAMVQKAVDEAIKKATEEGTIGANTVQKETVSYFKCYTDIMFPVSKSDRIDSQSNRDALARVSSEMGYGSKLLGIVVEGYASPEGENENNQKLSEDRAKEAADFVKSEIGKKVRMEGAEIEVIGMGADWDGLIMAIANENFEGAQDVANELRNADNENRPAILRKAMAKYPQIRYLFPQLRRANVTIKTMREE